MSVGTMPCWEVVPLGLALKVYWHGSSPTWGFLHHAQLCKAAAEDLPSNPGQPAAVLKTHGFAGDPLLIWLLYSLYKINNLLLMVEVHRASEVSLKELGGAILPSSGFWIDFFFLRFPFLQRILIFLFFVQKLSEESTELWNFLWKWKFKLPPNFFCLTLQALNFIASFLILGKKKSLGLRKGKRQYLITFSCKGCLNFV